MLGKIEGRRRRGRQRMRWLVAIADSMDMNQNKLQETAETAEPGVPQSTWSRRVGRDLVAEPQGRPPPPLPWRLLVIPHPVPPCSCRKLSLCHSVSGVESILPAKTPWLWSPHPSSDPLNIFLIIANKRHEYYCFFDNTLMNIF